MPDDRASRWDFPKGIWQRIAFWVPHMKDQPHWHAWTELRVLNRAFRSEIKDYYFEHYVKRTDINVRSGELLDLFGGMSFSFGHFEDDKKRIAMFTDNDAAEYSVKKNKARSRWLVEAVKATEDPGFNVNTIVTVRRELTDMLPVDLNIDYAPGTCTYKFDWRIYYSSYESKQPEFDAAAARISQHVQSGQLTMQDILEQAFKIIGPYAAEGAVGLFVPVRRKRRLRIGLKHPANKAWLEGENEEARKTFAEFDEDVVVEHIKNMRQILSLAELSDSVNEEDENAGEDEETGDEDEDEDDEWEDEDDDGMSEDVSSDDT